MSKQSDLVSVSQGASGDPLFIDTANNRVGVGTSSPAVRFHVTSPDNYVAGIESSTTFSLLGFKASNTTGTIDDANVAVGATGDALYLRSGGTERARIDASGNLLVGTTTARGKITVQYSTNSSANPTVYFGNDGGTGVFASFGDASGVVSGTITRSGSSTSYNTSSDYRLKENVTSLTGAADRLAQIPVCRFNFIADPDKTVDGFLAHEVQAFVPECVTGEKDQVETVEVTDEDGNVTTETRPVYQGIDQSKLVPLLTAALQEALQKIDALETRISALETN
jgi:hypothetical protein